MNNILIENLPSERTINNFQQETNQCKPIRSKHFDENDRKEFVSLFPEIIRNVSESPKYRDMEETNRWIARVLQYNVEGGKLNRGLAIAQAFRYFSQDLTEENIRLSYILGWCIEILQACFLVADDIMDRSEFRRNKPCWYKMDNLGLVAFNDALLMESTVYFLLKKYFGDKSYYSELVDTVHDVTHKTIYGQSLDTRTALEANLETFTMDRYSSIVKYKTSYYSFYLPIRLAMTMAGFENEEAIQQVEDIMLDMGHFFQVQDDYLDCFGDPKVTGKVGTDIQDMKCSWLFVKAVEKCNKEQKDILFENYGQEEQIGIVKALYSELGIPQMFQDYEKNSCALIFEKLEAIDGDLANAKPIFILMLNKIFGRRL